MVSLQAQYGGGQEPLEWQRQGLENATKTNRLPRVSVTSETFTTQRLKLLSSQLCPIEWGWHSHSRQSGQVGERNQHPTSSSATPDTPLLPFARPGRWHLLPGVLHRL
ncbi:hypothetical protein E2C01_032059 [Portunus trituberculatus]|uniref:Uncharacterized protein n=1 Tax=Portunus trituberculatus TaxID=210409 RepID=A0A5B7EUE4_PORTR|nr:hypothetical protein [Portunus trituberculatus]